MTLLVTLPQKKPLLPCRRKRLYLPVPKMQERALEQVNHSPGALQTLLVAADLGKTLCSRRSCRKQAMLSQHQHSHSAVPRDQATKLHLLRGSATEVTCSGYALLAQSPEAASGGVDVQVQQTAAVPDMYHCWAVPAPAAPA